MTDHSPKIHHCSFAGIVEFSESPHVLLNSTISIAATLQGPYWTTIPDLRLLGDIPLDIEFYNESNEELLKGWLFVSIASLLRTRFLAYRHCLCELLN